MTLSEAKEFSKYLARNVLWGMVLYWLIQIAVTSKDDSDPPDGHSGFAVRTDALTGCQYLETSNGGITPRLDFESRQIGCRR